MLSDATLLTFDQHCRIPCDPEQLPLHDVYANLRIQFYVATLPVFQFLSLT
jgi:hypothetical protein